MKIIIGLIATATLSYGVTATPVADSDANPENLISVLQDADDSSPATQEVEVQEVEPPAPVDPPTTEQAEPAAEDATPESGAVEDAATEIPAAEDVAQESQIVEAPVVEAPIVEAPIVDSPAVEIPFMETPSVLADSIVMAQPMVVDSCPDCCASRCCCPPPAPTPTTFCLVDPCGSSHQACITVPACCAGQQPTICWRKGVLRRQIATLRWDCCGHEVKVIITCRGRVKVRG